MNTKTLLQVVVASLAFAVGIAADVSAAAAESVQLHAAFFGNNSRYGCSQKSGTFDIYTSSFGNQKSVYVHLKERDGTWSDLPASFIEALPGGRELWRAGVSYGEGACPTPRTAPATFEFALKVVPVSGAETWDNNGGANYRAAAGSGELLGDVSVLLNYASVNTTSDGRKVLVTSAFVQNLAYTKSVDVVYSPDGWRTVLSAPLSFVSSYQLGYGSYLSPNASGVELWNGTTPSSTASCFDFVLRYRVSGQELYDNNLGRNYRACAAQ